MKKLIQESVKFPIERSLTAIEGALLSRKAALTFAPIFIVAPARSGSTLLYQAMTRYFDLCYFSNSMTRFPNSPVCVAHLLAPFGGCDPQESFRSRLGHIEGARAPSDGTKIWRRWFRDDPQYIPAGVLTPRQQREVRTTIGLFQKAFVAPFINKTQRNCGRILALAEIFPEAVFVRVHREPFEMVRSRLQIYRNPDNENRLWQSAKPSNFMEIVAEDPIQHICQQVAFTEIDIDRDRGVIASRGFFDVDYEGFCRQPVETLQSFAAFYDRQSGVRLKKRHEIPDRFETRRSLDVAPDDAETIRKHLGSSAASPMTRSPDPDRDVCSG
jgi:Sulfotransferase family